MTKKIQSVPNLQQIPKSAFDTSGPSLFSREMQIEADRSHRVSKFGQHITIGPATGKNSDKEFIMKRIVDIKSRSSK